MNGQRDGDCETLIEALGRLLSQLRSELIPLMRSRRRYKVTIHGGADRTWKLEVIKYLEGQ